MQEIVVRIRILGCHGSDHLIKDEKRGHECRACAFLINETVLVDAGTVGSVLSLGEQRRLRHVLVSHLHFDHIQGLPTLADSWFDHDARPVTIVSLADVLKGLQSHIFNGEVYPDFMQLPSPDHPVFRLQAVEPGATVSCGDLRVTGIPVNHQVPTLGFIIDDGQSAMVCSGDTYSTDELWKAAGRVRTLKAAFIEASFPNAMADVARVSKHLTPALLHREFEKIGRPEVRAYAYHLKPRYRDTLTRELATLPIPALTVLEEGQEITV